MLLFVSGLNAMHVGMPSGEYFYDNPLAEHQFKCSPSFKTVANLRGLFNIISLEEQRKTSHVQNKAL